MSVYELSEAHGEAASLGLAGDRAVLGLERLLEARLCRRLPWWRAQGFAPSIPGPETELPSPWPALPPGWAGPGRGWARAYLDTPPEWGLGCRADWVVEREGRPHLVLLGAPTPTLRLRARIIGAVLVLRGSPGPFLWSQGWPSHGSSGTWFGDWPRVQALPLPLASPASLAAGLDQVRGDLDHPIPPARSAPHSRCWDCPASRLCGDFY